MTVNRMGTRGLTCALAIAMITLHSIFFSQRVGSSQIVGNLLTPSSNSKCLHHSPIDALTSKLKGFEPNDTVRIDQPTPSRCGKLRRRSLWTNRKLDQLTPLARSIVEHQNDCSNPVMTFPVDNDFGLGSHLYLWSQAFCNAWETGHRLVSNNPQWLWNDVTYCESGTPFECYFGGMEASCPGEGALVNAVVTDPRQQSERCKLVQDKALLKQFRAASMEAIFRDVTELAIREAERQVGLLFPEATVPSNLIAVHLRWGDKFWEMDLAPIEEYIAAIKRMANDSEVVHIYLACEDPKAVKQFVAQAPDQWNIYIDRIIPELSIARPSKGNRASWLSRNTKGRSGLMSVASLLISLEADRWQLYNYD